MVEAGQEDQRRPLLFVRPCAHICKNEKAAARKEKVEEDVEVRTVVTMSRKEYEGMASEPFTLTLANGNKVTIEIAQPELGQYAVVGPNRVSAPAPRTRRISHHRPNTGDLNLACHFCPEIFQNFDKRIRHCKKVHPEEYKRRQGERHKKKVSR